MKSTRISCLIGALFFHLYAHSQVENPYRTEVISLDRGLSQTTVTSIYKDPLGFMWFATIDGLNRFDGYDVEVFKNDPTNQGSISSNQIFCVQL